MENHDGGRQLTKVLQERRIGGYVIRLSDDPNSRTDYRVAVIRPFPNLYEAMDFLRDCETHLKKGGDGVVLFKNNP